MASRIGARTAPSCDPHNRTRRSPPCQGLWRPVGATIAGILSSGVVQAQSWTADADVVFLKLGTSVGTADDNVFDFETGTRLASRESARATSASSPLRSSGIIPARTRRWATSASKRTTSTSRSSSNSKSAAGTFIELAGGVRYNESNHIYDGAPNDFKGLGGLVGLKGGLRGT